MRAVGPWPHAMGENCGEWKEPEEPVGSAVYDEFRPRGKLDPLPMLAGAEEGAAGEGKRDPSPRDAAAARVTKDEVTVGDPLPKRWAVLKRLPASFAKSCNFVVEGSFDLTLDVEGDFVEGAPFKFVVAQ